MPDPWSPSAPKGPDDPAAPSPDRPAADDPAAAGAPADDGAPTSAQPGADAPEATAAGDGAPGPGAGADVKPVVEPSAANGAQPTGSPSAADDTTDTTDTADTAGAVDTGDTVRTDSDEAGAADDVLDDEGHGGGDVDVDDDDVDEDDDDGQDEGEEPRPRGGLLTKQVQLDAKTIILIVLILVVAVGAYVLGQRQAEDDTAAPERGATTTTQFVMPSDFVPFDDKETGIKLAVPKDWVPYSTKDLDRSYRLLIGVPNAKDTLRVRMNAYSSPVTQENLRDQKNVVDAIFAQEKIQILASEATTLNGLPALFYVYKFNDASGEAGYHAHFFVFQGRKMVSLVFEAVPEARYALLAATFDKIATSIQIAPGDPPAFLEEAVGTGATPGASTTTVPGATTLPPATLPPTITTTIP